MHKKTKFISMAILALAIIVAIPIYTHHKRYAPTINLHPKYFLIVATDIDPIIAKHIALKLGTTYTSFNSQCQLTLDRLEDVRGPRYQHQQFTIKVNKNGKSEVSIPLDKYLPGYCNWQFGGVYFQFQYKKSQELPNPNTSIAFDPSGLNLQKRHFISFWHCSSQKCSLDYRNSSVPGNILSNKLNYTLLVKMTKEQ